VKKHAKKALRSVLAFAMAVVLLATSLPIAFAAGTYDPTPVFSEDATLWAWVTDDGDVQVIYPQATPNTEYISDKHIATYYITLYDLGPLTEVHNDPATETVPQAQIVVDASTATFASDGTGTVTFTAATLANKGVTLDDTHRFSVEVLAQDSTGWVSEPLTTIVSDVPQFVYDEELYKPLSENSTSVREMMLFEAKNNDNNDQFSDDGLSGAKDYIQSGDTLKILGPIDQAGEENVSTGVDSRAYGFQISAAPSNGTTQSFSTAWSRQHWMGTDAEEVWYWLDLSQVELTGLSFDLKANGKRYGEFYWKNERMFGGYDTGRTFSSTPADDAYSLVTYSTRGTAADTYKGEAPYVYIQQDNGAWEKVMLNNGTIDLGHYKGYVRVPIEFMCSTKATYAEAHNDNFNMGSTAYDIDRAEENVKNFFDTQVLFENGPVLVDEAGTPISDALLIQYRVFQIDVETGWNLSGGNESKYSLPYENDYPSVGANHYAHLEQPTWGAAMLAAGYNQDDVDANLTVNSDSDPDNDKAYVDANGVVQNRENGYKAIDDIFGAGFSYTGVSSDSVRRDFFIDNVLFYKETGSYPSDMTEGETGAPVTNYYDQKVETPRIILSQIDQLITTPDLGDFRAVQYIGELIAGYRKAYSDAGMSTDFLSEENMATVAASLGMSDVWQRYLDARQACVDGGTMKYDKGSGTYTYLPNNEATDLVPELIQSLEKLPDPSQVTSVSDTLRDEIIRLYQLYRRLNLTQLDAMSAAEEQRILDYVALVQVSADGEETIAGTTLATNPYFLFTDFENLDEGTRAYDLADSPSLSQGQDYRYTKGLVSMTAYNVDVVGHDNDTPSTFGGASYDSMQEGLKWPDKVKVAATDTYIAQEGAGGSKGVKMTFDSRYYTPVGSGIEPNRDAGWYNAISVTRNAASANSYDELRANNIADWNLSVLADSWNNTYKKNFPLGLIFYVDFSQLTAESGCNFKLGITISSYHDGTIDDYNLDMDMSGGNQRFKLMNMQTGEWEDGIGSGSPYCFKSNGTSTESGMTLSGYKGYMFVGLSEFEASTRTGTVDLCEMQEAINNIYRVLIGVAPQDANAAAAMDGRSFVVDDIGFGFGLNSYSADQYNQISYQTFEEVMGWKSTAAQNFENAVSAIEVADQDTFNAKVDAARALYDALSDYQKNNTPSVKQAYAQLELYEQIKNGEVDLNAYLPAHEPEALAAFVNGLSDELKNASVTGDYDLPYPGVKDTPDENGITDGRADAVNYEGYNGLTKALAAEIIDYYNNSYSRYTAAQKAALGETETQFLNAYNAASRCYNTLEGLLADSNTFLNELYNPADASTSLFRTLSEIYYSPDAEDVFLGTAGDGKVYDYNKNTPYGTHTTVDGVTVDEGNYISITDTKALDHISKTYRSQMNYYAKALLVAGELQEGVKNIPNAVRKLVYNSYSTDRHGDPFTGGIWTLYNRYLTLYNNAKAKINAGTALTDEELADLKLATDEYEMLLPTYHDVAELYDLIQQIYDLFPAVKSTFTATGDTSSINDRTMILAYDGVSATVENTADPIYTLTQFEQYLTNPDGTGKLTITSENGGTLKSPDGTISLPYTLTYNGTAADLTTVTEVGNYDAPMTSGVALHVKIDNPQEYTVTLSDKVMLTFTYQYTDRHGILREVTDQKTLTIYYTTEDIYTVTIPAEVDIPWGTENVSTDFDNGTGYRVTCNLNAGSSVSVQPTLKSTSFALIHDGTNESIACTGTDIAAGTFTGQVIEGKGTGPSITIAADEWKNIPVAAYRAEDQITYTVDYTDGSATP
jgi:hypothetical protein